MNTIDRIFLRNLHKQQRRKKYRTSKQGKQIQKEYARKYSKNYQSLTFLDYAGTNAQHVEEIQYNTKTNHIGFKFGFKPTNYKKLLVVDI